MSNDERFLGRVRRECLDHFLIFQEKQLRRLLKAYVVYFNQARPHQYLGQRVAGPLLPFASLPNEPHKVFVAAVLGGLQHDNRTVSRPTYFSAHATFW
jgi:putative transposase